MAAGKCQFCVSCLDEGGLSPGYEGYHFGELLAGDELQLTGVTDARRAGGTGGWLCLSVSTNLDQACEQVLTLNLSYLRARSDAVRAILWLPSRDLQNCE
jgi:hypothetical protein